VDEDLPSTGGRYKEGAESSSKVGKGLGRSGRLGRPPWVVRVWREGFLHLWLVLNNIMELMVLRRV